MKELMLFQTGKEQFGLDLSWIKGVYRAADLTELPGGSPAKGVRVCSLAGGAEILLYDFPLIFGSVSQERAALNPAGKVILVEAEGKVMAILADHIDHVMETDEAHLFPLPPVFGEKASRWFPSVFRKDTKLIPLLDPAGMADTADVSAASGTQDRNP